MPARADRGCAAALMLQGTGSDVGKSLLVAGLCRAFVRRGLRVLPFKPQNMSNNAAVAAGGAEIGRAQALQARACRVAPTADMNPILLKPQSETGAQVIVQGRVAGTADARAWQKAKAGYLPAVLESFSRLTADSDLVLVEGAGSPAEINLREGDIANMGFATAAGVPVVLVGDIERGGVIAQLVGTHALLAEYERALVGGYVVNKFRGDPRLFDDGLMAVTQRTVWPSLGVVPWFAGAGLLPAEDSTSLDGRALAVRRDGPIRVVVPRLPRIANFDDLDPLAAESDVTVELVQPGRAMPHDFDLIVLPGSKATIADLAALRAEGWHHDIVAAHRRGASVLGLCGGYQMLGARIADPDGSEGSHGAARGLGLLAVRTILGGDKTLTTASGTATGMNVPVTGYEMHIGTTRGADCARPFAILEDGRHDGARSLDGRIAGTYLHGVFAADDFRAALLEGLRAGRAPGPAWEERIEATLDALADHLARHLDLERMMAIARRYTGA
ncbi:MAG: cobyric acid synthase [Alphaproteobacteria bacterium]|nr:cobyric acid synthase [Alphaproteobacteria bacterium]